MFNTKLLPYETIFDASNGDVSALDQVISYFSRYINKLATHAFYDECGGVHYWVDTEIKHKLEMKLVIAVLKFRAEE